jgi:chromosome segregation ATPase
MALQELYPLFRNTKKQRLSKDFDLFSRDHAPLYRMDAVKRQFSVVEHELDKALDRVNEIRVAPWDSESMDHEMIAELEERKEMVTDGDKLGKEAVKTLEAMKTYTTMIDEESTRIRKEIADYVLSILPDAKDLLVMIDLHIQGEMKRLRVHNTELIGQNAVLESQAEQAGSSKDAEITAMLQKLQGHLVVKTDAEKTEFERLKAVEQDFIRSKGLWDNARQTFEGNEEQFRVDIEQAKEELEICTARLDQMNQLRQDAEEDIEGLENEKEKLGEELAKERKNALDQKQHARELQASLGEELDEKERKDRQIRQLEEDLQQLCQSKDERIQQLEMEKQELAQTKDQKIQQVAMEKQELAQMKDQTIQQVAMEKQELAQTKDQKIQQLEMEKRELAQMKNQHIQQLEKEKHELLQNAASKDRQISKLERKVEKSAADFELAKDRYREYYGISQMQEREHQGLLTSNDKVGHLLEHVTNAAHRKSNRIGRLHGGNMRLKKVVMGKNKQLLERNERLSRVMAQGNTLEQQKATLLAENEELEIDRDSWKKAAEDFDKEQTVWFEENERLAKSVDAWKKYAEDLDEEKRTWQQEKITLQNDSTTWKNAADALGAVKIVWGGDTLEMESATSTLLETLFQAQQAWDDEKDALKLQLDGSRNVALENSNKRTILVAQNDLQAAQLQGLDEELRNAIEEIDTANRDLTAMTNEKNEANQALLTMTTQRDDAQRDLASMTEDRDTAKFDLDRRTTERDDARRDLESVAKERDAATTDLNTTAIERDEARNGLESVTKERDSATTNLNTTIIERDEARRDLESATKERDAATANLNTTIIERDNVQRNLELVTKERDVAATSLDTRTIERDDAHHDLDSMTKERDATAIDLHARIAERDNAQRNLESITKERDQFHEELQLAIESTQQLQETFDEQKNQLEEARKERDTSQENSDEYRDAWVRAKDAFHTLEKDFNDNLKEGQALEEEHRLCAEKIGSEVHQQLQQRFDTLSEEHSSCQGLQQRLDKLRLDHSV